MNHSTPAALEAILFAAPKPLSINRLADLIQSSREDVAAQLKALAQRLEESRSGLLLQENGGTYELVTRPEHAEVVKHVAKTAGEDELTRAAVEALTILAYRGPLTRPELEQIRGVQSSQILRNLMIRGLIEEREGTHLGQPVYSVTFAFLRHLGLSSVDALPQYDELRGHAAIADVLNQLEAFVPGTAPTDAGSSHSETSSISRE